MGKRYKHWKKHERSVKVYNHAPWKNSLEKSSNDKDWPTLQPSRSFPNYVP